MDLKTITYISWARMDLSDADLADIHRTARDLNALDGITGLLVFDGVRFLQIVEGPDEAIDGLMERLRRDPRHSALEVRESRTIAERSFTGWSMELVRVSAGYFNARTELDLLLPAGLSPGTRTRVMQMAGALAA